MKINTEALNYLSNQVSNIAKDVAKNGVNNNLVENFSNLTITTNSYLANLKIIKTQQDLLKNIVDLLA